MPANPATTDNDDPQSFRWVILGLTSLCFSFHVHRSIHLAAADPGGRAGSLNMKMTQAGAFMGAFLPGDTSSPRSRPALLADYFGVLHDSGVESFCWKSLATVAMGYITTYENRVRPAGGGGPGRRRGFYAACSRALMEWFPAQGKGAWPFGILLAAPSAGILLSSLVVPPINKSWGWGSGLSGGGAFSPSWWAWPPCSC